MTSTRWRSRNFMQCDSASAYLAGRLVPHRDRPGRYVWILGNGMRTFPVEVTDAVRDNLPDPEATIRAISYVRWDSDRGRVSLTVTKLTTVSDRHWDHYEIRGRIVAIDGPCITLLISPRSATVEPFTIPVMGNDRLLAGVAIGQRLHTECIVREKKLWVRNWNAQIEDQVA